MTLNGKATLPLAITGVVRVAREQKQGQGEDASLCWQREEDGAMLIAVLDGCGGAGAMRYAAAENWSGARLASSLCGQALYDWFLGDDAPAGMRPEEIAAGMQRAMDASLADAKQRLNSASTIRGSMLRTLPTTLAAALLEPAADGGMRCVYLWAGDSRGFLFLQNGLAQMTTDDIKGGMDAQENLERDGVLSNVISASGAYELHSREVRLDAPCMVLTATDGCFSYFRSPIEFESLLLRALYESSAPQAWEEALTQALGRVASDDYTMELALIGFPTFESVKRAYKPWADVFFDRFGLAVERANAAGDREALLALWQEYRGQYMR